MFNVTLYDDLRKSSVSITKIEQVSVIVAYIPTCSYNILLSQSMVTVVLIRDGAKNMAANAMVTMCIPKQSLRSLLASLSVQPLFLHLHVCP